MEENRDESITSFVERMREVLGRMEGFYRDLPESSSELSGALAEAHKSASTQGYERIAEVLDSMLSLVRYHPQAPHWSEVLLSRGLGILQDMIDMLPREDYKLTPYFLSACREMVEEVPETVGEEAFADEVLEPMVLEVPRQALSADEELWRNYREGVDRLMDLLDALSDDAGNKSLIANISQSVEQVISSADALELSERYDALLDILSDWESVTSGELTGEIIGEFRERIEALAEMEEVVERVGGLELAEEDMLEKVSPIDFAPGSTVSQETITGEDEREGIEEFVIDWEPEDQSTSRAELLGDEAVIPTLSRERFQQVADASKRLVEESSKIKGWVEIYNEVVARLGGERKRTASLKARIVELLNLLSSLADSGVGDAWEGISSWDVWDRAERIKTVSDELTAVARELAKVDELALGLLESLEDDVGRVNRAASELYETIERMGEGSST